MNKREVHGPWTIMGDARRLGKKSLAKLLKKILFQTVSN